MMINIIMVFTVLFHFSFTMKSYLYFGRNDTKKAILFYENDCSVNHGDPYGIRTRECMRERHVS